MSTSVRYRVPAAPRPSIPNNPPYQTPAVAWPTLQPSVVSAALWIAAFAGAVTALLRPWFAIALLTIAAFMLFTVLHDGVHRSLLRGYPLANEIIATIAGASLGPVVTGAAFRYVHCSHHRNTNNLEKDPDSLSGIGPTLRMPLQWATVDFMYVVVIVREWSQIPRVQHAQIVVVTAGLLLGYAASWPLGWGPALTLY